MIKKVIRSGLGNQMFQYAAGRALSLRHNTGLILDVRNRENDKYKFHLSHFNIVAPPPEKIDSITFSPYKEKITHEGKPDLEILKLPDNTHLDGYCERVVYFQDFEKEIRQDFQFKDPISDVTRFWAAKMQNDPMPVSLHARLGDYGDFWQGRYVVQWDYYKHCVAILKENFPQMSLYVFSVDLELCRQNFNFGIPTYFVDANDIDHGWEDMFLIGLCRHHIASSGTFSWWSVFLDNRPGTLTFYPRNNSIFPIYSPEYCLRCIGIDK
ncbi:MAG: alpha-1,2-fucosyltransferase [Selenomonadaceae bacterium]|nr:alpha-1,2-fucosyltransferase [Selenomonadaceae bacterium]